MPIVEREGEVDLEQVKKELYDYHNLMDAASTVYDHVTRGRISKPNTLPREVMAVADDLEQEAIDEAVAEERQAWRRGEQLQ